ncbi:hypothetical protein QBC34DRAFT_410097 [Podospora aff. communis PSN243]|uniref:Uncharacterized protein n=1 Tax=Podospora aff. communis PSN243 TaxID=3040156 RepID=A0AAV9GH40_9PEZI|nr:hypothetical protein QBC34DRAFT_410097 [Podospora aff. communis PSN243]
MCANWHWETVCSHNQVAPHSTVTTGILTRPFLPNMSGQASYGQYINSLTPRYPSLTSLARLLNAQHPSTPEFSTHAHCIELPEKEPMSSGAVGTGDASMALERIDSFLKLSTQEEANKSRGLVVIVEDPGPHEMQALGALLDIHPLFFGGHLASSFERLEKGTQNPFIASCPSQLSTHEFINIHYKRVLDLGSEDAFRDLPPRLVMRGNVPRKARLTQALSGRQMGILNACVSVLRKKLDGGRWICLILLDSTTRNLTPECEETVSCSGKIASLAIPQTPRRLGVEGFTDMPSYSATIPGQESSSTQTSTIWQLTEAMRSSNVRRILTDHSIISLVYLPCRMAMAEWALYAILMQAYAKHYEYSFNSLPSLIENVKNRDFIELHRWRRRSRQSLYKLRLVEAFVVHWQTMERVMGSSENPSDAQQADLLLLDIKHIANRIDEYMRSLELMAPMATSLLQLMDSERSVSEAVNVRRLTYIALVFVPLSFVASIFSMGDDFAPGRPGFWVYFAVAIPMALVVLAFLKLDVLRLRLVFEFFRNCERLRQGRGGPEASLP